MACAENICHGFAGILPVPPRTKLYFETVKTQITRTEIVIQDFHTGNVLKRLPGILMTTPDGEIWMLD